VYSIHPFWWCGGCVAQIVNNNNSNLILFLIDCNFCGENKRIKFEKKHCTKLGKNIYRSLGD
jgi:hypothetical protein